MAKFFALILLFPFAELAAFFAVEARIGALLSCAWIIGSVMVGMHLLRTGGSAAWRRAKAHDENVFVLEDAFDSLCILIAALLLIFPGFISDFIAVPFLLPPFRHWLFTRVKNNPNGFMRKGYSTWTHSGSGTAPATPGTIEGEFRRVDDDTPRLPES